jgi:hypothetical protein
VRIALAIAFVLVAHLVWAGALNAAPQRREHDASYRAAHAAAVVAIKVEIEQPVVRALPRSIEAPPAIPAKHAYLARTTVPPTPRFYAVLLKRHVPRMSEPPL